MTYNWKCWGFMAFIQTKYRKKITDVQKYDQGRAQGQSSSCKVRIQHWYFKANSIHDMYQLYSFSLSGKWKSAIYCLPCSQTNTQTTLLFSLRWTQQRLKYTFLLKTLSHLKAYCLTYSSSSTKYAWSTNSKGVKLCNFTVERAWLFWRELWNVFCKVLWFLLLHHLAKRVHGSLNLSEWQTMFIQYLSATFSLY